MPRRSMICRTRILFFDTPSTHAEESQLKERLPVGHKRSASGKRERTRCYFIRRLLLDKFGSMPPAKQEKTRSGRLT